MRLASLILGAAIVVAAGASAAQQVSDCAVISRLAGSWNGRGSLQRTLSAEPEAVRCRLRFDWRPSTRIMTSTMECKGIDLEFKLWGSISVSATRGELTGAFFGSEGITNVTASGRCEASALALQLKENKPKADAPVSSDLTIALSDNGSTLSNLLEMRDPVSGRIWRSLSISFTR